MSRKQELMEYIRLLANLDETFTCKREVKDALEALHKEMIETKEDEDYGGYSGPTRAPLRKVIDQVKSEEHSKLVSVHSRDHRGIGKTTALINLAIPMNIPIVVGNQDKKRAYQLFRTGEVDEFITVLVAGEKELKRHFPNGVLVDESVSLRQYADLLDMNIKIRGGFFETDKYFSI